MIYTAKITTLYGPKSSNSNCGKRHFLALMQYINTVKRTQMKNIVQMQAYDAHELRDALRMQQSEDQTLAFLMFTHARLGATTCWGRWVSEQPEILDIIARSALYVTPLSFIQGKFEELMTALGHLQVEPQLHYAATDYSHVLGRESMQTGVNASILVLNGRGQQDLRDMMRTILYVATFLAAPHAYRRPFRRPPGLRDYSRLARQQNTDGRQTQLQRVRDFVASVGKLVDNFSACCVTLTVPNTTTTGALSSTAHTRDVVECVRAVECEYDDNDMMHHVMPDEGVTSWSVTLTLCFALHDGKYMDIFLYNTSDQDIIMRENSFYQSSVVHGGAWLTTSASELFPFKHYILPAHGVAKFGHKQLFGQEGITAVHIQDANNKRLLTIRVRPTLATDLQPW